MQLFKLSFFLYLLMNFSIVQSIAQDTLKISLEEFIEIGLENSGQLSFEQQAVNLAENRVNRAKANRFLPSFDLRTLHGLVPGVKSDSILPNGRPLPRDELFLDPDLENDFNDFGIFTRFDVNAVQPVYSWGALKKSISAARSGAVAAQKQLSAKKTGLELQLFELYQSYLLALETDRIVKDSEKELNRIGDVLEEMRDEGDPEFEEADMFKFEIFEAEFQTRKTEVEQNTNFIQRIWDYVLRSDGNIIYEPEDNFLDPVSVELLSFDEYKMTAFNERAELQGVEAGINATNDALEAKKAQNFPVVFLGLNVSYATTPNRPRQSNPFIINNTNFFSAAFGFGIRQNLNFLQLKSDVEKSKIEYNRMVDLKRALTDGIILELNNAYKEAVIADTKVKQTDVALTKSKKWVRHEQLNYDIGFGNSENLIDAIRQELELRVTLKQSVFELNKKIATLHKASGLTINKLNLE